MGSTHGQICQSVWPDVEIKIGPEFSKRCQKSRHRWFYLKRDVFKEPKRSPYIWAIVKRNFGHKEFLKIAQSGHTAANPLWKSWRRQFKLESSEVGLCNSRGCHSPEPDTVKKIPNAKLCNASTGWLLKKFQPIKMLKTSVVQIYMEKFSLKDWALWPIL